MTGSQSQGTGRGSSGGVDRHGNSVAGWTAVTIAMIGFLVMAVAVLVTSVPTFVAGAVTVGLGGLTGLVLSRIGFGAGGRSGH